jgi:hypothetical protein
MADWVGSPHPYSYVPEEFIDYTDKMSFWERTQHNCMPVRTRGKATDPLTETKCRHAQILQLYCQFAVCLGAGIQDVFSPYKQSPHSQLSETVNAKLRTGWRDARKST